MSAHSWALGATAALLNTMAYALGLYNLPGGDEGLHFFTLFALAYMAADALRGELAHRASVYFVSTAAIGLALGTAWEIAEWLYDRATPENVIAGKADTMSDLLWDGAGAILAALIAVLRTGSERARPGCERLDRTRA